MLWLLVEYQLKLFVSIIGSNKIIYKFVPIQIKIFYICQLRKKSKIYISKLLDVKNEV